LLVQKIFERGFKHGLMGELMASTIFVTDGEAAQPTILLSS
jgi:hypothetical protein